MKIGNMKKTQFKKKMYVGLKVEIINTGICSQILAGSPPVQPGGGGGGSITVIPPKDDDDEELTGAKRFSVWEDTNIRVR